jgi:sterol desaturase/sphingolipid hydroxylase (fatty acid hydroxylase superfamily)
MHRVHHSRHQPETDSNYSSLFSFWDRFGRSFRLRDDPTTIELVLHGWDAPEDQRFAGLLWTPLKDPDVAAVEVESMTVEAEESTEHAS